MKLLIHDLKTEEWKKISADWANWETVSDDGTIHPCTGCFCCWDKDPGRCAVRDGYEDMGSRIHHAEEVAVISRYTYGGFSGFVKNVFDRSLGYVLPQLMLVGSETHHKRRYEEDKPFTFIFYGSGLSDDEKSSAERYVTAVCANIRGHVKQLVFWEIDEACAGRSGTKAPDYAAPADASAGKVLFLNGSMRSENGNSATFAREVADRLGNESMSASLRAYRKDPEALARLVEEASDLVLCMPLYVDGLPSQVIRFMEYFQKRRCSAGSSTSIPEGTKRVYVLSNMGLYESGQLVNLFEAVRQWCAACGLEYCGGLGVSAGELIGVLMRDLRFISWPVKKVREGMDSLARAIDGGTPTGEILAEPYLFPCRLYLAIVNTNWNSLARKNGISPRDLYRQL